MVTNWNPWGQPGNGAPNMDTRIRNLEVDGLYPVDKNVQERLSPVCDFFIPKNR